MSNGDKRSVSTDALETLGTAPLGPNEARDAIHLAVEPVIAGEKLFAGQDIGLVQTAGGVVAMRQPVADKLLGIVDPFLNGPVYPGDRFWLIVYPRQIKSLRHVWEHPDFENLTGLEPAVLPKASKAKKAAPSPEQVAKDWIENYAFGLGVSYDDLMWNAEAYQRDDWHYWVHPTDGGRFEGEELSYEFWERYAVATGKPVDKTGSFFSCAC